MLDGWLTRLKQSFSDNTRTADLDAGPEAQRLTDTSGSFDKADEEQQDDCPDGGVDDGSRNATADTQTHLGQDQTGNECTDDPNHDVAQQAKTVTFYDQPGEPTSHSADKVGQSSSNQPAGRFQRIRSKYSDIRDGVVTRPGDYQ